LAADLGPEAHGWKNKVVGANTTAYYLGMALGAFIAPGLMRRGSVRCAVLGMTVAGVTAAVLPWGALWWWFAVRFAHGIAGALSVIPLETYVNRDAPPECRARNFGFYAVALMLGYALGNAAGLELHAELQRFAFALGGAVSLLAALVVWLWLPEPKSVEGAPHDNS